MPVQATLPAQVQPPAQAQAPAPGPIPGGAQPAPSGEGDPKIHRRAVFVSRIFEILATIALVLGVLASIAALVAGIMGVPQNGGGIIGGVVAFVLGLLVTAVYWASITLASLIAGYIAQRSQQ